MRKNLLLLVGIALAIPAMAEDFVYEYEGQTITYTVLDEEAKTCETKLGSSEYDYETWTSINNPGNDVTGDLVLPANPKNGDMEYTLVSLGDFAFVGCKELNSVVIPATVTKCGESAFDGCYGLKKASFASMEALVNMEFAEGATANPLYFAHNLFIGDEQVNDVVVPEGTEVLNNYVFAGLNGVKAIDLPSSLTAIGEGVFNSCGDLESISIPEGVTSIGMGAFMYCPSLASIDFPASMTTIAGYCFYGCSAIEKVNYASLESLFNIDYADTYSTPMKGAKLFVAGEEVTDLVVPESVTEVKPYALYEANFITSISMPGDVESIGRFAFNHCYNVKELQLSTALKSIGDQAFEGCPALSDVLIPPMVTEVGNSVFNNCTGILKSAYPEQLATNPFLVPDPWGYDPDFDFGGLTKTYNGETASMVDGILYSDGGTTLLYVPTSVKSVDVNPEVFYISENAFAFCNQLESVTLPEILMGLGENVFMECSAIKTVVCLSTMMAPMAYDNCFMQSVYDDATLYVPEGMKEMYASAECWKNFKNVMEGVPGVGVDGVQTVGKARFFDLKGQEVENPTSGIFIRVLNGKAQKVIIK